LAQIEPVAQPTSPSTRNPAANSEVHVDADTVCHLFSAPMFVHLLQPNTKPLQ
jgi:hypothetical protein